MTQDTSAASEDRTFIDEIQARWPDASPDACEVILWITPYPAGSLAQIFAALDKMREKWGPNIGDAINGEMAEFDATMRSILDEQKAQANASETIHS